MNAPVASPPHTQLAEVELQRRVEYQALLARSTRERAGTRVARDHGVDRQRPELAVADLQAHLVAARADHHQDEAPVGGGDRLDRAVVARSRDAFETDEAERIVAALNASRWNVRAVSRALRMPSNTLYRKLKRLGITRPATCSGYRASAGSPVSGTGRASATRSRPLSR